MGCFPNIITPQYSIHDVTLSAFKNKKLELFPIFFVDMFEFAPVYLSIMNKIGCSLLLSK